MMHERRTSNRWRWISSSRGGRRGRFYSQDDTHASLEASIYIVFLADIPSSNNEERTSNPRVAGSNPAGRAHQLRISKPNTPDVEMPVDSLCEQFQLKKGPKL